MHRLDIAALISTIVGACSVAAATPGFSQNLTTLVGPAAPKAIAIIGIVGLIGGQVIRVIGSPSSTPASK